MSAAATSDDRNAAVAGTMVGKYMLGRVIGKGVSSEVRLATDTEDDQRVAIKIIQKEWIWTNEMSNLVRREIEIMKDLDHESVVKLIEVFNSKTHVFMAMEAVDGRELYEEITSVGKLQEDRARDLFNQLMVAVEYLHSIGVAHRDLKLENILLSKDGKSLKVTDFGLAARLNEWEGDPSQKRRSFASKRSQRRQHTACGTPSYAAPEVISSSGKEGYDARGVDTWCAGIVLFAMVTGHMPFQEETIDATLNAIMEKEPAYPEQLSVHVKDLLRSILQKDPTKRATVGMVLAHPWVASPPSPPPPALQHKLVLEPVPTPGAGEVTPSPASTRREELAAAAKQAIETAKQAASEAERAAAEAHAAEAAAALAIAAAAAVADGSESGPSSSVTVSVSATAIARRGFGRRSKSSVDEVRSSPREKTIKRRRSGMFTLLTGRQFALKRDWGRSATTEDGERDDGKAASRCSIRSRDGASAAEDTLFDDDEEGVEPNASEAHTTSSSRYHNRHPDHRHLQQQQPTSGSDRWGLFATTETSVSTAGVAAVTARRKLLARSQSMVTPGDRTAPTALQYLGFAPVASTGISEDTSAVEGQDGPGSPEARSLSVRARAYRASMESEERSPSEEKSISTRNGGPPPLGKFRTRQPIGRSLSCAFATTSSSFPGAATESTRDSSSRAPAAAATPPSPPPPLVNGGASSSMGRDLAFDVVVPPAAVVNCAAVKPSSGNELTDSGDQKAATATAAATPAAVITSSLSSATTMSLSPLLEDADRSAEGGRVTLQGGEEKPAACRPASPVTPTATVGAAKALVVQGASTCLGSSPGSPSVKPSEGERLPGQSADLAAERPSETSPEHPTGPSARSAVDTPEKVPGPLPKHSAENLAGPMAAAAAAGPELPVETLREPSSELAAGSSVETTSEPPPGVKPGAKLREVVEAPTEISVDRSAGPAVGASESARSPSPPSELPSYGEAVARRKAAIVQEEVEAVASALSERRAVAGPEDALMMLPELPKSAVTSPRQRRLSPGRAGASLHGRPLPLRTPSPPPKKHPQRSPRVRLASPRREPSPLPRVESTSHTAAPSSGDEPSLSSSTRCAVPTSPDTDEQARSSCDDGVGDGGTGSTTQSSTSPPSRDGSRSPTAHDVDHPSTLTPRLPLPSSSPRPSAATTDGLDEPAFGAETRKAGSLEGSAEMKGIEEEQNLSWLGALIESTERTASSTANNNNLRERVEEEKIWVSATTGDAEPVRRHPSGRYRRVGGQQHAGGGEASAEQPCVTLGTVADTGSSVTESGGEGAPKSTTAATKTAKAAAATAAATASSARTMKGAGAAGSDVDAKKPRKRGKSIGKAVAKMFRLAKRKPGTSKGGDKRGSP